MKIGISIAILLIWTGSLHAQTDVIVDGTFDAGTTPWNFTSPPWNITTYYSCYDMEPGYAYFGIDGGGCNSCSGNLYQTVTIPSCASSATLGFHLSMSTDETGSTEYDIFNPIESFRLSNKREFLRSKRCFKSDDVSAG